MDLKATIREFITTNFYVPADVTLGDDESLLDTGLVDSTGMLEVLSFLEERFGIAVADTEMVPDNLGSIANLTGYVGRKL